MRKILTTLAVIALTLASCSKEKENCNCNNGGTTTPTTTIKPNQIMLGYPKDFKKFNITETIPNNYSFYNDEGCAIANIPSSLEFANKHLNAFFEKFTIVDSEGFEITHTEDGHPFVNEKMRKWTLQKPYEIEPICTGTDSPTYSYYELYGLYEKENIVVFYKAKPFKVFGIYRGGEFEYDAINFYKFPNKEIYRNYVNMLKNIYTNNFEKYAFYELPVQPFPLIYCGNVSRIPSALGDRGIPSFIPKTIEHEKVTKKKKDGFLDLPFNYYNSHKSMRELNQQYARAWIGKYRFEIYYKSEYTDVGDFAIDPFYFLREEWGQRLLSIKIGGKRCFNHTELSALIIKPMPEHRAIAFYRFETLEAFLLFPNDQSYNEYMAMLKDIFNTPEAQESIFLNF